MKLLFYRYNSIYEPAIISALTHLGHEITEVTEEMENKDLTPKEQLLIVSGTAEGGAVRFCVQHSNFSRCSRGVQYF